MAPGFVDCHSHVVPSGDDGAKTLAEGIELCELARDGGTAILFATPHVWPHLVLTSEREASIRAAYAELRAHAPLDLRLGFELTPAPPLLNDDPARYVLEGTNLVLVEVPFAGPEEGLIALGEHIEAAGLVPLIAHPERTESVQARPQLARELAERGWPLQVNATSLLGRHSQEAERLAWRLVEGGEAKVVASDGHRVTRPARLDDAYELVEARVGEDAALPLFDGTALALSARPTPSRAVARGA
ncbi:MAG: CpsB/CapC family capsule biosynthesis tyrosine phosphatase [Gaiellaceae bacterium]